MSDHTTQASTGTKTDALHIERAVVLGAGTMGHGIAQVCAMAGIHTTLIDLDQDRLDHAHAAITKNLEKGVARGKVTAEAKDAALALLHTDTGDAAYETADLFVEAVPENMALKQSIFKKADALLPAHALLGTNTSSLSITDIAQATARRERVIGLHFFNPVHIMKLLEIVRADTTSDATLADAEAFGARIGKTTIVVRDMPGFATSRLGLAIGAEAMRMFEEGVASAADIDAAMRLGYGHPVGPLELTDMVGLDVRLSISTYLYEELGNPAFRPPAVLKRLVRMGHVGKKAGRGFYTWEDGKKTGPNAVR